jgi:uncharacterized protein
MHALLQWLVGLAMLCNSALLSAQTFADGDTLKYTVLAERVNENTTVVRLAALNETSLFWANQQGILLKRYTVARDGSPLSDSEIESSQVEFPLTPMSSVDMGAKGAASEMWQRLHDAIYSTDFQPSEAAEPFGLDPTKVTRHFFSNFVIAQSFDFGVAQALAFEDNTTVKNEGYVYFASSTMSADEIAAQFNLHGFRDEKVVFSAKWQKVFIEEILNFEDPELWGYYGYSGDNTVEEESFFTLPKPEPLYGSVKYLEATVQPSTKLLMKYYKSYKLQRLNNSSFQWDEIATKSVFAKEHKFKEELAQNKVEYSYLLVGINGFYGNWLGGGGPPSDVLKLKADVPIYKPNERPLGISAKYKNEKGSLKIRWVPTNYETWDLGNKKGYFVERIKIADDKGPLTEAQKISSKVTTQLFVKPESQLILIDTISTQAIYHPEDFEVVEDFNNPAVKIERQRSEKEERMGIVLFRADDSLAIARALALAFEDRVLKENCKYQYTIGINGMSKSESMQFRSAIIEVSTNNWRSVVDDIPLMQLSKKEGDKAFGLLWSLPEGELFYSSFIIEMKKKGTSELFRRVNETALIYNSNDPSRTILFEGGLPENDVPYLFRVKGHTPFGQTLIATNEVEVVGHPAPLEERPFISEVKEEKGNFTAINGVSSIKSGLKIKWTFPEGVLSKISGFEVWRSSERDGKYDKIAVNIPVNINEYMDIKPMRVNYYVVIAKDKNLYDLPSLAQVGYPADETPPAIPHNVKGLSDESGTINITWDANTEEDLKGYYVYWNNNINGEFLPIANNVITNTNFIYSVDIKSLTKKTYFKVAAVDYRDNLSTFSPACEVKLPDIVPPATPVLVGIEGLTSGVKLKYVSSGSDDLSRHEIRRKADYEAYWDVIKVLPKTSKDSVYIDTTGRAFVDYLYKIVAIDSADLASESINMPIKNFKDGARLTVTNPYIYRDNVVLDNLKKGNKNSDDICYMKVYWEYPEYAGIYDFQIYRSYKNSPYILIRSVTYNEALLVGTITPTIKSADGAIINGRVLGKPKSTNSSSSNPSLTVPEGVNPPLAPKPIRAFLACDDDLNTTIQAVKNPTAFKYQIMVRFLDGTASRFTGSIGIK